MDSDKSSFRVPFDGKEENYPMWAEKFKGLCVVKGFTTRFKYTKR